MSRWCHEINNGLMKAALIFAAVLLSTILWYCRHKKKPPMPPGPWGLPLVGSLPFPGPNLHHRFAEYAKTYGPIFRLRLGTKLYVVVSSPAIAKEVYKDNDIVFSNHDRPVAARVISYGCSNLVRSPYGQTWRMLHRVFLHELLNGRNLDAGSELRCREVRRMVKEIRAKSGAPVNVGEQAFATFVNLCTGMVWGERPGEERDGAKLRKAVKEIVELMGRPNVSDFLPFLAWLDLQGIEREIRKRVSWLDRIYEDIIEERTGSGGVGRGSSSNKDFLSILLEIRDGGDSTMPLTTANLKGLIMDIMVGGTSVTSTTVEWVMAELMRRADVKNKAQEELDSVVGADAAVAESHVPKLHYLRAVIKEALRLHPVVPLLVPRVPSQPCVVAGYTIPEGSHVVTSVWAIHTDPGVWDDPLRFRPERFLASARDVGGEFRFFPFGAGKRRCAGLPLVERMLPLVVATMLREFEWKVPEGMEMDLRERAGVTLTKERPVLAIPTPRFSPTELCG